MARRQELKIFLSCALIVACMCMSINSYAWWYFPKPTSTPRPIPTAKPTPKPIPTSTPKPVIITDVGSRFITREDWGASAPTGEMLENIPYRVSIHHTAILQNPFKTLEMKMLETQSWHQADSRQPDISYHFFIDFRGDIAEGRELKYMIVPSAGYDGSGLIHITLEGDFTQESPNNKQIDSLVRLIRLLRHTHEIEIEEIKGHKDFVSTTLCPGNLYIMLSQIRDEVQ